MKAPSRKSRPFPRTSMLLFVCSFVLSLLLLPSGYTAKAAFGDDPHNYGEILVYDNITTNPAPGDFFGGGYNNYPHQGAGIELPIGQYRIRATWNGTSLQARIYQRNAFDHPTCDDNFAGIFLGPNEGQNGIGVDTGHIAVNPLMGQDNAATGFLCTFVYLNWRNDVNIRIQIYRVFEPEYQLTSTSLRANVPIDAYVSTNYFYQWVINSYIGVITASLTIDWAYTRRGVWQDLQGEPYHPSENLDPDNCITLFNGAGFNDYICHYLCTFNF